MFTKILINKYLILFLTLLLIALVCIYYYYYDPGKSNYGLPCFFKLVTGLNCAGCGGQRALHNLLHGNFLLALRYNFFIYLIPFFLYLFYVNIEVYIFRGKKFVLDFMFSNKLGIIGILIILVYMVLRNIPYVPFIYLSPPN
ncbi:DUF2752 domain-containing protein [uncultured Apibacter sp.]|uniref:DUF2752 domain-containing protein n=1 Tax=uncultured Apibacter sp. TaxID=1778616 RepID=UPI0034590041